MRELCDLYDALTKAWNDRDAAGMAHLYLERGTQVGFDGSAFVGPAEIEANLTPIFRDHPTARFVTIVREVREIAPGVGLLRADAGMIPPGKNAIMPERNAIQTLIASKTGDQWHIELFQNTPAALHGRPEAQEQLTRDLQREADRASVGSTTT